MKTIQPKDIPVFFSEAEEAAFWSAHELSADTFVARATRTDLRLPTRKAKSRLARLEPRIAAAFPNDESVNQALELILKAAHLPTKQA